MNTQEFAAKVRAKYPGSYDSLDDATLTQKIIEKYPQYKDSIDTEDNPSQLGSFARGAMSGIPGAETVVSGIEALSPNKTYEQAHSELETAKDKDWEVNPWSYGAGKGAGMVGTGIATGGAGNGLKGALALGAGIGALSGADASKNISDIPMDAVKGAPMGAAMGAVGHGIGKTIEAIPGLAKGAVSTLGKDLTTDDISAYLKNPSAIRQALTKPELAESLSGTVDDVTKASQHLSSGAREILSPEVAPVDVGGVRSAIDEASQKYLTNGVAITSADKASLKTLQDIEAQLIEASKTSGGKIPETTLRQMIDRLQAATKESSFGNPEASASQGAMRDLSGKLNGLLRQSNPEYAAEMAPSAEAAGLSSGLQKKFLLDDGPTDATVSKLGSVLKEGKTESQDLLEQLKGLTGQDFVQKLKDTMSSEHFNAPGSPIGSVLGKLTGIPFLKHAGADASAGPLDGGRIAKKLLDMYISGSQSGIGQMSTQALQKFGPILANAAKQGGNQLASTYFVLSTSNPEFQDLVKNTQNSEQQP